MGRKWIRRGAALAVMLLVGAVGAWGGGSGERPSEKDKFITFTATSGSVKRQFLVSAYTSMGATVITLKLDRTGIDYVAVMEGTSFSGTNMPDTLKNKLQANLANSEYALTPPSEKSTPLTGAKAAWGGAEQFGAIPDDYKTNRKSIEVPITTYGGSGPNQEPDPETRVRVLLIHGDRSWERLEFYLEFFEGEQALFKSSSLPYFQKAVAFMDSFFTGSGEQTAFRSAAKALYGMPDTSWGIFNTNPTLTDCQQVFRSVFKRHLGLGKDKVTSPVTGKGGSVSFLSLDSKSWGLVYGGKRSVYMAAYLRFLYERGKPILSKVLNQEMKRLDGSYAYDWSQYEKVSEGEQLARAALRYLTWGVEYSLPGDAAGSVGNAVYAANESDVKTWVTSGGADRGTNYQTRAVLPLEAQTLAGDEAKIAALLTSPFNGKARGNPLPYARRGIDSPRTFAYKMWEQKRVYEWAKNNSLVVVAGMPTKAGTAAAEGRVKDGYVDEAELLNALQLPGRAVALERNSTFYKTYVLGVNPLASERINRAPYAADGNEVLKPFIPGIGQGVTVAGAENSRNGLFNADKMGGVDSIGMLVGSLAMADSGDGNEVLMKRVLGIGNQKRAEQLDKYYHMSSASPGLDSNSKPTFYADPLGSQSLLSGEYLLSRADLERSSVLVPDVHDIAVGDLLVKDGTEDGYQVGVVVGFGGAARPAVGQDGTAFMSDVIVLSVDRTAKKVYLSRAAGGRFAADPRSCQVRRLLKLKDGGSSTVGYGAEAWELVDTSYSGLAVALTWGQDFVQGVGSRWIPNTGEMLEIAEIQVRKQTPWGGVEGFAGNEVDQIAILGPKDYGYKETEPRAAGSSNIWTNQGGQIELYAIQGSRTPIRLATFQGRAMSDEYSVTLGPNVYGTDGKLKRGYTLKLDEGTLRFSGGGMNTQRFGLRIKAGEVARPGDDFLLRFGVMDTGSGSASDALIATGTAAEKDYVAVYDKKLLWRANLYIKEEANDWNDSNAWNAADNEWNYTFDGTTFTPGDGKQTLSFTPFTWTPVRSTMASGLRAGKVGQNPEPQGDREANRMRKEVSYDIPEGPVELAFDSPFDFIYKLTEQRANIRSYYSAQPPNDPVVLAGGSKTQNELANWPNTYGPFDRWKNYRRADASGHHAYLPGLGLLAHAPTHAGVETGLRSLYVDNPGSFSTAYGAGTDCVGFVQRAAGYNNSPYSWAKLPQDSAERYATSGRMGALNQGVRAGIAVYPRDVSTFIVAWNNVGLDGNKDGEPASEEALNLYRRIIPGDVVYYETGGFGHIGIVQRIDAPTPGMSKRNLMNTIHVIESVFFDDINYVTKTREAFADYWRVDPLDQATLLRWQIVRLKVQ